MFFKELFSTNDSLQYPQMRLADRFPASTNAAAGPNTATATARNKAELWDVLLEMIRLQKLAAASQASGQSITNAFQVTNPISPRLKSFLRTNPINGNITFDRMAWVGAFMGSLNIAPTNVYGSDINKLLSSGATHVATNNTVTNTPATNAEINRLLKQLFKPKTNQ